MVEEDAAGAARLVAVRQEEVVVAPGLEARIVVGVVPVAGALNAAWKSAASSLPRGDASASGRRRRRTSPSVVRIRVLKCAAGTRGLRMCATRLMPLAQKRGSCSAPGICARNSGRTRPTRWRRSRRPSRTPARAARSSPRRRRPRAATPCARSGRRRPRRAGRSVVVLDRLERGAEPVAQRLEPGARRAPSRRRRRQDRPSSPPRRPAARPSAAAPRPARSPRRAPR